MNTRINASSWTQGLHQAAHENETNIPSLFSELDPIFNLPESLTYPYHRVDTSATVDLRSPSSTSSEVHLSVEHNSVARAQGHLKPSKPKRKLVPVPPEYRRDNEDEHTRISSNALFKRKRHRERVPVPPEYWRDHEDEHTRISPNALALRMRNKELVPIPLEYRRHNEDEHALISTRTLTRRKLKKLNSTTLFVEMPHALHQAGETSAANTLTDSNNRINASNSTQGLHQAAHEDQTNIPNSFSELHPISNVPDSLAYPYHRVETSTAADLRSPSTASGKVQLSDEHNSTSLIQGRLEPSKPKQKLVPVPPEHRLHHEDENTRIKANTLSKRISKQKLVSVPPEYWLDNENEHTRISFDALTHRKRCRELVSVPSEFRLKNEDEHTLISSTALAKRKRNRKLVPVPLELRRRNEGDHALIRIYTLEERKRKRLKSAAHVGEESDVPHQTGETSAAITLADSNSARQNSPILARSASGSNAPPLHEPAPQVTMENYESLAQFGSETAFSHWLDDVNAQQSAIDYMLNYQWQNGTP